MIKVKAIFGHSYNGMLRNIGDIYEIEESDFAIMKDYSVFKEVSDSDKITEKEVVKKEAKTKELK